MVNVVSSGRQMRAYLAAWLVKEAAPSFASLPDSSLTKPILPTGGGDLNLPDELPGDTMKPFDTTAGSLKLPPMAPLTGPQPPTHPAMSAFGSPPASSMMPFQTTAPATSLTPAQMQPVKPTTPAFVTGADPGSADEIGAGIPNASAPAPSAKPTGAQGAPSSASYSDIVAPPKPPFDTSYAAMAGRARAKGNNNLADFFQARMPSRPQTREALAAASLFDRNQQAYENSQKLPAPARAPKPQNRFFGSGGFG